MIYNNIYILIIAKKYVLYFFLNTQYVMKKILVIQRILTTEDRHDLIKCEV